MKTLFRNISPEQSRIDDFNIDDIQLKELFDSTLPKAEKNPWFTRRVMNRLPERNCWASVSFWQWICYSLGFAAMLVGLYLSIRLVISSGFTVASLISILSISLLVTICGGMLTVPTLVRILRDR